MQSKLSKHLEGLLARAAFDALKHPPTTHPIDLLALRLLKEEGTIAYQIIQAQLGTERMEELTRQLEKSIMQVSSKVEDRHEKFFSTLSVRLYARFPEPERIGSIHLLIWILEDPESATAPLFFAAGITPTRLFEEMNHLNGYSTPKSLMPAVEITPKADPEQEKLLRYGIDLTEEARRGAIDPVEGREKEIGQMIHILCRRRKNNPVLVGEAGVGKSALVEGLALKIVAGEVPSVLKDKRIFSLDVGALVSGTKFRGEFEERLHDLLKELRRQQNILLFIDEIHTIAGAGSSQGSLDMSNLMKPLLARGEMQTIGATTPDEFRRYIESDAALTRRFRKVTVEPTNRQETLRILERLAPHYALHHGVNYPTETLERAVRLAERYLTDRHFPDKAIDLMDEAGAHVVHEGREEVTPQDMERVITLQTGIPTEQLSTHEGELLQQLEARLSARVIGQKVAIATLSQAIRRSRSGIRDHKRPIGVFLFSGPSGVGKTLLAKELSKELFGTEQKLIRLNMNEFSEPHTLSRLIGSPPGYVGYGEGGELTEAVRRNPYSVILFDEIEKAHKEIYHLLLQLFDEGHLSDSSGRRVDFRNTVIIMTSNQGNSPQQGSMRPIGFLRHKASHAKSHDKELRRALEEHFPAEFLGRIDEVIRFDELSVKALEEIIEQELALLRSRSEELGYRLRITPKALRRLADRGNESRYGARSLRHTLRESIEDPLSGLILGGRLRQGSEVIVEPDRNGPGVKLRVA